MKIVLLVVIALFSACIRADGVITGVNFSGPDDSGHPNIVQIQIAGGYNDPGCDSTFAAIRNTAEQQHMISFALAAFIAQEPVRITLTPSDKYFADRCAIIRISSVY